MSDEMRKNLAGLLDEMESTTAEHRELNTSNYGHDDVCQLNNWGIGACELMERVILTSRAQPAPMAVPDGWEESLNYALVIETERAIKQRDEYLRTGVSTAGHGGSHDTAFAAIVRQHIAMLSHVRDAPAAEQPDTVPVPRETMKRIRSDLDACQRVIHLAGGFDPAYVTDAQARLKEIDALLLGKENV